MCDIRIPTLVLQPEDESGQVDYRYDEFGFKVEVEGNKLFELWTM